MLRVITMLVVMSASVLGTTSTAFAQAPGAVVYPAPEGETLSGDFTVTVAGQAAPVYVCRVSAMPFNQVWPGYQRPIDQTELASFVYWDMSAPVDVEVVSQRPVESVAIRPTARGIQPQVEGNRIRFHLDTPQQLTVEVNGWHKALHVFANPPAVTMPDPNAPGVRYFGPGIHRPGRMTLQSNETVYLAGGAVVYGCFEATGATNIKILGPGILDSSELERYFGLTDESKYLDNFGGCIHLVGCTNVTIDGPILRDPPLWCLSTFNCSEIQIAHIKLIGLWRYNADGIDLCNSRIDRHFSRFPEEELERINALVPGRPLMERHDVRGSLPRGTFFRSRLHADGELLSVRPDVYVLRTSDNQDFILNIEGGVYRETSIGFSFRKPECSVCGKDLRACDHIPGRTYGENLCHCVLRDVLEVIEGSVVASGSQGTRFVAGTRALRLDDALAAARRDFHTPIELGAGGLWEDE